MIDRIKYLIIIIIGFNRLNFAYDNNFVIIIPSYKNANYYKKNLDSVFQQTYENYRVIYIDDCSSDDTGNLVEKYVQEKNQSHRLILIKNKKRQLALANIYKAILMCLDNEIIVMLDGDDELENKNVLAYLNNIYKQNDIWITYGNYKYLSNDQICDYNPVFPEHIIKQNKFREFKHGLTHLRTFYAWLFKQIRLEDLFFDEYFFKMTYDSAIFLPMIEMAAQRHKFITDILYIYNDNNPINDHRVSTTYQHYLNKLIRQKEKYQPLNNSKINFLDEFNNSKTDVIVFLNNSKNLLNLIEQLKNHSKLFEKIYLINNSEPILPNENLENIFIINKQILDKNLITKIFNNIFDNDSRYIMFLNEKNDNQNILKIDQEIKNLELTKAFSLYMGTCDSIAKENVEILEETYAFVYSKAKYKYSILRALYRKKDISKKYNSFEELEIEWEYIGWNKVCLFKLIQMY